MSSTSLQKFKNNSWCVGGRHYSGTSNIKSDNTQNKNGAPIKLLKSSLKSNKN